MSSDLAFDLVLYSFLHKADGVEIFKLDFVIEYAFTSAANRDISFAAKISLFHIGVAGADPLQSTPNMVYVIVRLPRSSEIRRRDDLAKRCSSPIEIDVGVFVGIRQTLVNILSGVLFEMHPLDVNGHGLPFDSVAMFIAFGSHYGQLTVCREGLVILRDLVTLWQVGIEIILS